MNNTYTYDPVLRVIPMAKASKRTESLPVDSPKRRRLPLLLRQAWYGLNRAFRRRLATLALTPDQFTVLRTLMEQHGITQRRLASLISSDPNTVASLINRMEKAELIERETHEADRRANRLGVSRRGKARYEQAREVALALQVDVLKVLPEANREIFLEQLETIARACGLAAAEAAECKSLK